MTDSYYGPYGRVLSSFTCFLCRKRYGGTEVSAADLDSSARLCLTCARDTRWNATTPPAPPFVTVTINGEPFSVVDAEGKLLDLVAGTLRHSSEFRKDDQSKPQLAMLSLLPEGAAVEVAKAFEHGGKKYGFSNYKKGTNLTRYAHAAVRHLFAWLKGETNDPESGLNHLAHCAASVLIVLELQLSNVGEDDRWVTK